jgi:hypothetical protein
MGEMMKLNRCQHCGCSFHPGWLGLNLCQPCCRNWVVFVAMLSGLVVALAAMAAEALGVW